MTLRLLRLLPFLALAFALAVSPHLAEAKAGKSSSMGSRGSRTYVPPQGTTAKPIERSATPPPSAVPPATAPSIAPAPRPSVAPPLPAAQSTFFQRHPIVGGLLGGMFGAGLASLLFGGHFFGAGTGGLLGVILQLALLAVLAKLAYSFFRGRSTLAAGRPQALAPPPARANPVEFALGQNDLAAFEGILREVQAAWSAGNGAALPRLMTPEMADYLGAQLRDERAQGVENHVEQVRLTKGDVDETWQEGPAQYATVTMTWTAVDYTLRIGTNQVVDGDPRSPQETTEVWTFVRRQGGPWQMSAIQQV